MDSRLRNFFFEIRMWDGSEEHKDWVGQFRPYVTSIRISLRLSQCWEYTVTIKTEMKKMLDFLSSDWCRFGNLMSFKFGYLNSRGQPYQIGNRMWVSHWFTGPLVMPQVSLGEVSSLDLRVVGTGYEDGILLQKKSVTEDDIKKKTKRELAKQIAEKNRFEGPEFDSTLEGVDSPLRTPKGGYSRICDFFILDDIAKQIHGVLCVLPSEDEKKMGRIKFVAPQSSQETEVDFYAGFFLKADIEAEKPLLTMESFESTTPLWFYNMYVNKGTTVPIVETRDKMIQEFEGVSYNEKLKSLKLTQKQLNASVGASTLPNAIEMTNKALQEGLKSFGVDCSFAPGVPWIEPGMKMKVVGIQDKLFDDVYCVYEVENTIGDTGIKTDVTTWRSAVLRTEKKT